MLQSSNELSHIILDVLAAPWRENDIFGFFEIQHTNRGRTKYGINIKQRFLLAARLSGDVGIWESSIVY